MLRTTARPLIALIALALAACGPADIELAGTWDDGFEGTPDTTITNELWGDQKLVKFDNEANVAITQNPATDVYGEGSANKFNKVVWTDPAGDAFFLCTVGYGKASQEGAENSNAVSFVSESEKNCGGFLWSKMTLKK